MNVEEIEEEGQGNERSIAEGSQVQEEQHIRSIKSSSRIHDDDLG